MCANCHREIHGSIIPCPTELINNEAAAQEAAKRFEENKLIHSIEDGTGSIKYALCESHCKCTPEFTHAHFHCTICEQTYCLRTVHVPEIPLPKNFQANQASFILKGFCDQCKV